MKGTYFTPEGQQQILDKFPNRNVKGHSAAGNWPKCHLWDTDKEWLAYTDFGTVTSVDDIHICFPAYRHNGEVKQLVRL